MHAYLCYYYHPLLYTFFPIYIYICKTFGTCNFENAPKWYLNGSLLHSDNFITYLGTTLTGNVTDHINTRIQAAKRAYYGLQSSGEYVVMG